ncbi:hypothetical protein IU501_12585 [Nocardia otitidiscaviarum]|uniref:WXG100 family type VII secretion target n=1 Tax=Nocardia otitidiscaviarum TaxID=1823 RepID=UPI0004A6ADA4|nr:hypothetical protein [Nocardia otitidiscaviarum]MBF6133835.1 hypothetical protein [Nocardia otitidiscaviarum]MBF6487863.1 hypothetical protein [Nocardia otitidiscaviarum]
MAPENTFNSDWDSLTSGAEHSAGWLKFDPTAVADAVELCSDVVRQFRYFRRMAEDNKLDNLPKIGTLTSGDLLAQKLSDQGTELLTAFDNHIALLTDMADAFVAAGKAYIATETDNESEFANLNLDDAKIEPGVADLNLEPTARQPELHSSTYVQARYDPAERPGELDDYDGAKRSVDLSHRHKDSMQWHELYDLGQAMNIAPFGSAAGVWYDMSGWLDERLGNFRNEIQRLDSRWSGVGAEQARQAVQAYVTDTEQLTAAMKVVGLNLDYTADWMAWTSQTMPDQREVDDKMCEDTLGKYRGFYQRDYVGPADETASVLAIIKSPTVTSPTVPERPSDPTERNPERDPERERAADRDQPGSPTSPSGTTNSSGTPGTSGTSDSSSTSGAGAPATPPSPTPALTSKDAPTSPAAQAVPTKPTTPTTPTTPGGQTGPDNPSSPGGTGDPAQLVGMLSSLISAVSPALTQLTSQLPTIVQQVDASLTQGDNGRIGELLGVPEERVTQALVEVRQSPEKLSQLGQLLGLSPAAEQQPVTPAAASPPDYPATDAAVPTPAAGQVATAPSFTNLFGRAGLDGDGLAPAAVVVAGAVEDIGVMAETDRAFDPVELVESLREGTGMSEATVEREV